MEKQPVNILILAGGEGTRLWPLSRRDIPKQFHYFGETHSLLQKSILRYLSWPNLSKIFILTNSDHRQLVEQQVAKLPPQKSVEIVVEPARRNTAAAIALGVKFLQEANNSLDIPILVTPSDHLLENSEVLHQAVTDLAEKSSLSKIILFGIRPHRPETGYGYIKLGSPLNSLLYHVKSFEEKPSQERAELFLKDPEMVWNSGMLFFSPRTFWNELKIHAPQFSIESLSHFSELPNLSIDYALLEKCENLAVCPLSIPWSDVGCWDSIYELSNKDHNENAKVGNVCEIETKNSLIMGSKRLICTIGVEDLLIIDTDDTLFISKKGESQKVKALLRQLNL
jgi:mannose-1-phosphate guanylyltransferase/mannose-6-phosphate isomerase